MLPSSASGNMSILHQKKGKQLCVDWYLSNIFDEVIIVLLYTRLLIEKDNCISSLCLFYLLAFFSMCLCMYVDSCSSVCTQGDSRCLTVFHHLSFWDDGGFTGSEVSRLAQALGTLLSEPSPLLGSQAHTTFSFLNVSSHSGPHAGPASV